MEDESENLYITGKAGTGKSFLLEFFVNNTNKKAVVIAPTGVAALNVGGQTIHSFFQLDFEVQDPSNEEQMKIGYNRAAIFRAIDTIVIDEVSMVSVDIMIAISKKMQIANKNTLPFGGKQVIMFGDLYQLPPVITNRQVRGYLEDVYGSYFFFAAPEFRERALAIYELNHVYRQKEEKFISILNKVRVGNIDEDELELLNSQVEEVVDGEFITLTTTNAIAGFINNKKLANIKNKEHTYKAKITGNITQSSFPTEIELKLKVGAQVMMIVNDTVDPSSLNTRKKRRWVNGTLGIVTYLSDDVIKVAINGVEHSIDKYTWEKIVYDYVSTEKKLISDTVAKFKQFPIKLAWAITIHKAQGQTYKSISIDVGNGAFENGQIYVALSRCVDLKGLNLRRPLTRKDIKVSQEILNFMENVNKPI